MDARRIIGSTLCVVIAAGQAAGQAMQLPTVRQFGVSTSVVVPDGGGGFLGGVDSASSGRTTSGTPLLPFPPLRSAATGSQVSSGGARVLATVHDFAAMDQRLLGQAGSPVSPGHGAINQPLVRVPAGLALSGKTVLPDGSSAGCPAASVGHLQAQHAAEQTAKATEAQTLFEQGQRTEAAGKAGAAKVYYQMAARRASGDLKDRIDARLRTVSRSGSQASP